MVVILDNGHGDVLGGVYQTRGKQSPDWKQGVLYEGAWNRWLVNRIREKLTRRKIPYYHISPELKDITLKARVNRANKIHAVNPNVYLLSIHANGGGGVGIEAFTSRGKTGSDKIADVILTAIEDSGLNRMRYDFSDGDKDKESGFYILRNTNCKAILLEGGFMDNPQDYKKLLSEDYIAKLAEVLADIIEKIYKNKNYV